MRERTVAGATVLFSPFDGEIFVNPFPFLLQIRGMDGIFFLGRQKENAWQKKKTLGGTFRMVPPNPL